MTADGVITWYFVTHGLAVEGNPFLRFWVRTPFFLFIKYMIGVFVTACLWFVYRWYPGLTTVFTVLLLMLYTVAIVWNVLILI